MAFKMKGFKAHTKSPLKQEDGMSTFDFEEDSNEITPSDNTTTDNTTTTVNTEDIVEEPKYEGLFAELEKAKKANELYKRNKLQDKFQFGEKGFFGKKYQLKKQSKEDSYRLGSSIRAQEEDKFVSTDIDDGGGKPWKFTHAELQEFRKAQQRLKEEGKPYQEIMVVGKKGTGIHPAQMRDELGNPTRRNTWREGYQQRHYYVVPKEAYWQSEILQDMRDIYIGNKKQPKSYIEEDFGSDYVLDNPLD